jgi:sodium transport system permease protein
MTAGERERRSLEPLLSEPIGAFEIVFGKWLVAAGVGMVGTSLCVVAGLLLLERSALPELGVRLESGLPTALAVALMLAPLCGLVAAAQLAIGLYAKSFKDAQSYLTLFSFTPIVAGFATTGTPWAYAGSVPITWELTALGQPLLNAPPQGLPFTTMALIELALTLVVLGLAARRLGSEEILNSA